MPEVVVDVWYRVGARDKVPGRRGFAHLFEHVMFRRHEARRRGQALRVPAKGRRLQRQRLDFAGSHKLLRGRPPESARVGPLVGERLDGLFARPPRLQGDPRQPAGRREERATAADGDRPAGLVQKVLLEALYPPDHPYFHEVIGPMEALSAASVEDVKQSFAPVLRARKRRPHHRPRLRTAQPNELVRAVDFGPIPAGPPVVSGRLPAPEVRLTAPSRIVIGGKNPTASNVDSYPSPPLFRAPWGPGGLNSFSPTCSVVWKLRAFLQSSSTS